LQSRIKENGIVIQWSICQILGDFGPSGSDISISYFRFDLLATEWLQLTGKEKAQYNSKSHTQPVSVFTASLLSLRTSPFPSSPQVSKKAPATKILPKSRFESIPQLCILAVLVELISGYNWGE
jgi:hypothetical protein